MRLLLLLLFIHTTWQSDGGSFNDVQDGKFLHKIPSSELASFFTATEEDKEVKLDFNEDPTHGDIRRSPEIRLAAIGEEVMPLGKAEDERTIRAIISEMENATVTPSEISRQGFDRDSYEFMLAEGQYTEPSVLAVLPFSSKNSGELPIFSISMDRMGWFSIGDVTQTETRDDASVFEVPVILKKNSDVKALKTKGSVYKFVIQAQDGGTSTMSNVRVEILSVASTTQRSTTTEEIRLQTTMEINDQTTTIESTTTNTMSFVTEESSGSEIEEGSGDVETKIERKMEEGKNKKEEKKETKGKRRGEGGQRRVLIGQSERSEEEKEESEEIKPKAMSRHTPGVVVAPLAASGEEELEGAVPSLNGPETKKEASSEEDDNPLTGAVTLASTIVQSDVEEVDDDGIKLELGGMSEGGVFEWSSPLNQGDQLRGLTVTPSLPNQKPSSSDWFSIFVDRPDLFVVRPSRILAGHSAFLFSRNAPNKGEVRIKISANHSSVFAHKWLRLRPSSSIQPMGEESSPASTSSLSFTVSEDAVSGTTIGRILGAKEMRIVGNADKLALLGDELVVSCRDESGCLDYEKQKTHHLILLGHGSSSAVHVTVTVSDKNDNSPSISMSSDVLRMTDNALIMPVAIEIIDADSSSDENVVEVGGTAAAFLSVEKVDDGLYQVVVSGPAQSGHYELEVRVTDGVSEDTKKVPVEVQNLHSRAHFRRAVYERKIKAEKVVEGNELVRVELEGFAIDEARFVIIGGNPGWMGIDDYDGTIHFSKNTSPIESGRWKVSVAAVSREGGRLLATTEVEVEVVDGEREKKKRVFEKEVYEKTVDRESSEEISVQLTMMGDSVGVEVEDGSLFALNEDGQEMKMEMTDITLRGSVLSLRKESVSTLRLVAMRVTSGTEKASVIFHLFSSDEVLLKKQKMVARPVFPQPWTREHPVLELTLPEERPLGQVLALIAPRNPLTGGLVPARIDPPSDDFHYEPLTGALSVSRRWDVDTDGDWQKRVTVTAGEEGFESTVTVIVSLTDIDDNPPVIDREGLAEQIVLPENLSPGTLIARLRVSDVDSSSRRDGLTADVEGVDKSRYHAVVSNGTLLLSVAEGADLDREISGEDSITVTVRDKQGHEDSVPLSIRLTDENDNAPRFERDSYALQAVENWPAGLVLDRLRAIDRDSGASGRVAYSLLPHNAAYFSINETSGELKIQKDLMGLAREEPYELTAMATDGGVPPLNSSVSIRIKISEPLSHLSSPPLSFISPPLAYSIAINEDTPLSAPIYQAKAKSSAADGTATVHYSIQELNTDKDSASFGVDETSGEIVITRDLDYEKKREHVLKLSARDLPSATETSRVMRVEVERGVKRRRAEFDKSSPLVFPLRRSSICRVAAVPHGRPLFYYLMPTCSPLTRLFSIDREFGELMFSSKEEIPLSRVSLCVYVSPDASEDVSSLAFDPSRPDMLSLLISAPSSNPSISHPDLANLNNSVQIIDPSLESSRVPVQSSFSPLNYSISDVQFTPADNVRPTVLPLAPPLSLFRVDDQGEIRVSPAISTQPHGVYRVDMDVDMGEESMKLQKEFHLVSKSDQMRFVFDIPPSQLSMQMEDFKRELRDAISVDHPETKMEVAVGKEADVVRSNQNRSSLCFHVLRNSVVLPGASSVMSVSDGREESHSRLAALYQAFHVVDIEDCLAAPTPTASSSAFSALLSSYTLLLCLLSLLSLILFSLIVYFCFVRRYRMQVQRKIKDLHASRPPRPIELNAPTFVLAPATLPPPSSLGYWDP